MKFYVSGGGTGGHFFPALALLECMQEKGVDVEFVGSQRGIEYKLKNYITCKANFVTSYPFIGRSIKEKLKAVVYSLLESLKLTRHIKTAKGGIVFGGYASLPLGMALIMKRKPLYLHEQNSVPSATNTFLSRFATKVFITFEHSRRFLPQEKVIKTGLPVRKSLLRSHLDKRQVKESFGFDPTKPVLLIIGGSQGAEFLNRLALDVFSRLSLQGIHITGEKDRELVSDFYRDKKLPVKVFDFSDKMEYIYTACDVAISRAGASTITELSLFGIPAVFVPFPFSAKDHQFYNAKEIEQMGGGIVLRQEHANLERIIKALEHILTNREDLSKNIKMFANPNACEDILRHIIFDHA